MFKEKLEQVQKTEAQAVGLIKKAKFKSSETIEAAKIRADEIRLQAQESSAAKIKETREIKDKEVAGEVSRLAEDAGRAIEELRLRSAAAIDKAAAEIVRRVTRESGA